MPEVAGGGRRRLVWPVAGGGGGSLTTSSQRGTAGSAGSSGTGGTGGASYSQGATAYYGSGRRRPEAEAQDLYVQQHQDQAVATM